MHTAAVHNPLESTLDILWYGRWRQTIQIRPPEAQKYAFIPLGDLWDEEVESDTDSESNESATDEDNNNGNIPNDGVNNPTENDKQLFSSDSDDKPEELTTLQWRHRPPANV
jgi:hypothetical protein